MCESKRGRGHRVTLSVKVVEIVQKLELYARNRNTLPKCIEIHNMRSCPSAPLTIITWNIKSSIDLNTPSPWFARISLVCFSFVRIFKTFPKYLVHVDLVGDHP